MDKTLGFSAIKTVYSVYTEYKILRSCCKKIIYYVPKEILMLKHLPTFSVLDVLQQTDFQVFMSLITMLLFVF